jgi:hypothetical protein
MTLLLKDPDAVLDYSVDWGTEYLLGDLIAESSWTVEPVEVGGVAVAGTDFDAVTAIVKASGGVPGRIYRLTNHVQLASGRVDNRSIVVRVEKR